MTVVQLIRIPCYLGFPPVLLLKTPTLLAQAGLLVLEICENLWKYCALTLQMQRRKFLWQMWWSWAKQQQSMKFLKNHSTHGDHAYAFMHCWHPPNEITCGITEPPVGAARELWGLLIGGSKKVSPQMTGLQMFLGACALFFCPIHMIHLFHETWLCESKESPYEWAFTSLFS